MKYPQAQFAKLVVYLRAIIEQYGLDKDYILDNPHLIHSFIFKQVNYNDDNLNVKFIDGKRLFPIDTMFELYPNNCIDDNIETAIKKAIKIIF